MIRPYILGLDVGTTNCKAVLADPEGREVVSLSSRIKAVHPGPVGYAEWNPDELYSNVVLLIKRVTEGLEGDSIRALAISSMGEVGVPIDDHGRWTYPAIAWYDTRTAPQAEWWRESVGPEAIYRITGLPISTSYGLLKLMWLRENQPECYDRTRKWLPIGDYIAFRLCGASGIVAAGVADTSVEFALSPTEFTADTT